MGDLDRACLRVRELIPDADYIKVGRMLILRGETPEFLWVIDFMMPRRNKAFRVMRHQLEEVHGDGETLEAAIDKAVKSACYHRTGKFTTEEA